MELIGLIIGFLGYYPLRALYDRYLARDETIRPWRGRTPWT